MGPRAFRLQRLVLAARHKVETDRRNLYGMCCARRVIRRVMNGSMHWFVP